ncbi:MAG TPA: 23S rRNA (guanosine(2251)-2'-O)-methyltransferase RlmB [Pyrinomonadaceae bacterium]|jgi:23S rRNA (guanosine2251-2'-O)-methyltransferase
MKNLRRYKPKAATPPTGDERARRESQGAGTRNDNTRRDNTRSNDERRDGMRNNETRNNETRCRGDTARGGREARAGAREQSEARHTETRHSEARQTFERRDERPPDEAHLYGVLPVLEALRAGNRRIERITIAEGVNEARLRELFELAREFRVTIRRASRAELQRIAAAGANHQGVVAHVAAVAYRDAGELTDALAARVGTSEPPLAVVLDGVEDPRNLGAIIRTAECAGVHGLFVPERRAAGLTETVAKAAAGALEYLPVARATNIARLVEEFKERGIWTIGTDAEANIAYTDWDWTQPCALLFGGEGAGLRRLVRERCDALVRIPLRGRIPSLNVSVAAAVVLYEALRQRTLAPHATYEEGRDDGETFENREKGQG